MFKNILKFTSSQLLVTIGNLMFSFFAARILGPNSFGIFQAAKLTDDYAEFLYLGMPISFRKEIPRLLKHNKQKFVTLIISAIFSFGLLIYGIYGVLILLYAYSIQDDLWSISLIGMSLVIFFRPINSLGNIYLKSINAYTKLSWIESLRPVILIISIGFIPFYGLIIVIAATALVSIISGIIYFKIISKYLVPYFNFSKVFYLIKSAFPIYLISVSSILFITIDRFLIASLGDVKNLGLYTIGSMISSPVTLIVSSISLVVFTEMNSKIGDKVVVKDMKYFYHIPIHIIVNTIPTLLFIGILLIPWVVNLVLPEYVAGIAAAQILVIGIYYRSLASFGINGLYAIEKHQKLFFFFLISGILEVILIVVFLLLNLPLIYIALANFIGNITFYIIVNYYVHSLQKNHFLTFIRSFFDENKLMIILALLVYLSSQLPGSKSTTLIYTILTILVIGIIFSKPLIKLYWKK